MVTEARQHPGHLCSMRRWWQTIPAKDVRHAPEKEWTGGRRKKTRNPTAAVGGDTPEQAAARPLRTKMQVNQLLQLCRKMNVDCRSHVDKEDLLA